MGTEWVEFHFGERQKFYIWLKRKIWFTSPLPCHNMWWFFISAAAAASGLGKVILT